MSLILIPIVFAVLIGFYFLDKKTNSRWINALFWFAAWWAGLYVILKFSITPPLPESIIRMFMAILTIALLIFVSADSARLKEATTPLLDFILQRKFRVPLTVLTILLPLLVAGSVYLGMRVEIVAPVFGRSIHPAPPGQFTFKGKTITLSEWENPFRKLETENPGAFRNHVAMGREVYYKNCVFCHGDTLEGNGLFAHGFNPIPANFADSGTIPQLQESYVFWRVAKGGPGLPDESGPWSSAMPAWENFLSEDEIWDAIMFLYDFTNTAPRAKIEHETE